MIPISNIGMLGGVGGFKSIALRKFVKEIKSKYEDNCEFTIVLCSDTDVFEFASKLKGRLRIGFYTTSKVF